jgi:geranylgeranyl diphosphate synthase type II
MLSLKDCQSIINQHLNEFQLPRLPENLYEPIRYILNLEAKRLRPSLTLMACNMFNDHIEKAIYPALAIEVFHNFTLMHDDIMDNSDLRRNHKTVHVQWNRNIALLSGDAMVIKAYELLLKEGIEKPIIEVFNETALKVCEGQQYDMDFEGRIDVGIEEYLRMVEYKTAVLLAASLKIGAISGGASLSNANLLYEFGRNIGIAFQLQDDLLDAFSDTVTFGKMTGNDIVSNKKTILMVEALHKADAETRKELMYWINRVHFKREDKVGAVKEIYKRLALEDLISEKIRLYHQVANENLEKVEVLAEKKSEMFCFSTYLMSRKK